MYIILLKASRFVLVVDIGRVPSIRLSGVVVAFVVDRIQSGSSNDTMMPETRIILIS